MHGGAVQTGITQRDYYMHELGRRGAGENGVSEKSIGENSIGENGIDEATVDRTCMSENGIGEKGINGQSVVDTNNIGDNGISQVCIDVHGLVEVVPRRVGTGDALDASNYHQEHETRGRTGTSRHDACTCCAASGAARQHVPMCPSSSVGSLCHDATDIADCATGPPPQDAPIPSAD